MSVWVTVVVAKDYQHEAELGPFYPGWIWDYKKCLPDKLYKYDSMGYPAPSLPTNESRLTLLWN